MIVKNRRGDLLIQKDRTVVESNDTVYFYLNESCLAENEMYVSTVSFDGGNTYGAITEIEDFLFAVTPQKDDDIVVRFYVYGGDLDEIRNPPDGEKLYTIRYTTAKEEMILVEWHKTVVNTIDGVEYCSGSVPILKVHPSEAGMISVSVDDGKDTKEYTVAEKILSIQLKEGTYKIDVSMWSEGKQIHAKGFPKVICYDTKAPSDPSFTICVPEDGGYYPEFQKCQYYASGSLTVHVESVDKGSGVEKIYMRVGNEEAKETDSVQIMAPFTGTVYAKSVDRAGNASPWVKCAEKMSVESNPPEMIVDTERKDGKIFVSGTIKDDSGLFEITITSDDKSLFSYRFENGDTLLKEKSFSFSCSESAIPYKEQIIEIQAEDLAGNEAVKQMKIGKSDKIPPVISIEGCGDYDVKREEVCLRFLVSDENLDASSIEGWATRTDEDGTVTERIMLTFPETVFTEEGNYDVTVKAEDFYANKAERKWNFMIDKTAPVIQGVREYDGSVVESFSPMQEGTISVSDWSGITYRMYLNGKDYDGSGIVKEPGNYVLMVSAEDGAGNAAMEKARFRIAKKTEEKTSGNVSNLEGEQGEACVTALQNDTRKKKQEATTQDERMQKKDHTLKNWIPYVVIVVILFLILLGILFFFVFKGNLTQNTGCDRLDT